MEAGADQIETQKTRQGTLLLEKIRQVLAEIGAGTIDGISADSQGGDTIHFLGNVYFADGTDPQIIVNAKQKLANFCEIADNPPYAFGITQDVKVGQNIKLN